VRNVARVVEYLLLIFVILRLFLVDLWAIARGRASVTGARRHRYRHGILCRTAFALNQTLQSLENILKLTFSVQHLMFVNLLFIDFTQR